MLKNLLIIAIIFTIAESLIKDANIATPLLGGFLHLIGWLAIFALPITFTMFISYPNNKKKNEQK